MVGVFKIYKDGVPQKVPMNTKVVLPDEAYVFFATDITLTLLSHKRVIIVNNRGNPTVTRITINPAALDSTFHAVYKQESTTEVTEFIVPLGDFINNEEDGVFRASRTLNNEVIIRVTTSGRVSLTGNISLQ